MQMMWILVWTNHEMAIQGHSKVIHCCADRCSSGIYDLLVAINSNLTSIFNRSWDITPSFHIHTPPLFQVELEKTIGRRWTCFGVRVCRTLDYPTVNLNPHHILQCMPVPHGHTNEHHRNSVTIHSNEHTAC